MLLNNVNEMLTVTLEFPIKLLLELIEALVITPAVNPDSMVDEY